MKKWDVVTIRAFPFTDGTGTKRRPAVIVADPGTEDAVFLAITGNVRSRGQMDVLVPDTHPEFPTTGLKASSRIVVPKIWALHQKLIDGRLGELGPGLQGQVTNQLRALLGLP